MEHDLDVSDHVASDEGMDQAWRGIYVIVIVIVIVVVIVIVIVIVI